MSSSGAGWSEDAPLPPAGMALAAERYTILGPLGQGGMGEVLHAWDNHLNRAVALKRLKAGSVDPGMATRLLHEARLTAHLDHPGVVAALDVGTAEDGQLFYTMRLVRGRTLAAALPELSTPERVRYLLAATEAVAYAHAHGVLHRDLKPENIMVGPFGETQVVDWGLACRFDEQSPPVRGVVGTPAYRSPEQALGEAVGPQTDVYALGVVLRELLGAQVAPALRAVVDCATAADPAERYADGSALAADLRAYLDGRVVGAHGYSPAELLALWARRWRWPLRLAGLGLTLTVVGVAVAGARIVQERDRALAAERASERVLAQSLSSLAVEAVRQGARAEAEVFASRSFALEPSALAMGARMAFAAQDPPLWVPTEEQCDGRWLIEGDAWACDSAEGLQAAGQVLPAVAPDETVIPTALGVWRLLLDKASFVPRTGPAPAESTSLGQGWARDDRLVRIAGDRLYLADGESESVQTLCPLEPTVGFAPDGIWLLCRTAKVLALREGEVRELPLPPLPDGVRQVGWTLEGPVISGGRELAWIDPQTGAVLRRDNPGLGLIRRLRTSRDGHWLWVEGIEGGGVLLDGRTGAVHLRLADPRWRGASVGADGTLTRADGDRLVRLRPPDRPLPSHNARSGIASAKVGDDGRVVLGYGPGTVEVVDAASRQVWRRELEGPLTKVVTWSGSTVWVSLLEGGIRQLDGDGEPLGPEAVHGGGVCRRLVVLDGEPACLTYGRAGPSWPTLEDRASVGRDDPLVDAGQNGPDVAVVLSSVGEVLLLRSSGALEVLTTMPGASWVDVDRAGQRVAVVDRDGTVTLLDGEGVRLRTWQGPEVAQDVALSDDGSRVAVGYLDGTARIWSAQGELLARLEGIHEGRVATVDFGPGVLLTAGWDGRAHQWSLAPLSGPAAPESVERAWKLTLTDLGR